MPAKIITVIQMLRNKWKTKLYLYEDKSMIETSEIEYHHKGILQGDMLSFILFVLSVNPLSFMLHKKNLGYKLGEKKNNLSHAFFVDDLKLCATCIEELIKLLEIVVEYSRDIGMSFPESKCAYQCIKRGKRSGIGTSLKVMHLTVLEIKEGDHYKYLGIDQSVEYDGPLNKE